MSVWSKIYERLNWKDLPQRLTALAARNLNKMDLAIDTLDDRTIGLNTRLEAVEENPITVDTELKPDSENPVQNKVIYAAFEDLLPEETVQGNPISINDASGLNAKACSVDLLPIQDLHGYDSPWVGGAGVNKWDEQWESGSYRSADGTPSVDNSRIRSKNRVEVLSDSMYLVTLASTIIFLYDATDTYLGYKSVNENGIITPITWYANAKYMRFSVGSSANPVTTYTSGIAINYPSSVTTYTPYENICPISGRTKLDLTRTGKNLMSPLVKGVGLIESTGAEQVSATSATTDYIPIKFTEDVPYYYLSGLSNQINSFINAYNANKQSLGRTSGNARTSLVLDKNFPSAGGTPQGTGEIAYIRITQFVIAGQTATIDVVDSLTPQLEIGQTATDYEAYQGETYTETLGQTVYGGNVDFVSGEGQNDYEYINPTSVGAVSRQQSSGLYYCIINSGIHSYNNANVISSHFVKGPLAIGKCYITGGGTTLVFVVPDQTITTKEQAATWLQNNNVQFAIPLATPTNITSTPTQIALLKGNNVISTDGDNINLKYSADIKAWVENQLSV